MHKIIEKSFASKCEIEFELASREGKGKLYSKQTWIIVFVLIVLHQSTFGTSGPCPDLDPALLLVRSQLQPVLLPSWLLQRGRFFFWPRPARAGTHHVVVCGNCVRDTVAIGINTVASERKKKFWLFFQLLQNCVRFVLQLQLFVWSNCSGSRPSPGAAGCHLTVCCRCPNSCPIESAQSPSTVIFDNSDNLKFKFFGICRRVEAPRPPYVPNRTFTEWA